MADEPGKNGVPGTVGGRIGVISGIWGASMSKGPKEPTAAQPPCWGCPAPSASPAPSRADPRRRQRARPLVRTRQVPGPARAGVHLVITVTPVGPSPWHCQPMTARLLLST